MTTRAILHVDMDAFYASVEQRDDPALRGRPVMVGARSARGVVTAASYEARQFGVHSAMPAARARRLCPDGHFVPPRFARYREVSAEIFRVFSTFSERVEGVSLDEAFLDVTDSVDSPEELVATGRAIKREISGRFGLTASVGISHNKLLAKIASDYDKPDGMVYIRPDEVHRYLDPLPVRRIWGIGPRSAERLNDAGIYTAGQLRRSSPDVIEEMFGGQAREMIERAAGIDHRPVKASRPTRSISQETTFADDIQSLETLYPVIDEQAEAVAQRLSRRQLYARTVTIKLRSSAFATITRSHS
ncbi:MAG: DNA polymerase IV, partial [Wenzhouxiangella sp.]